MAGTSSRFHRRNIVGTLGAVALIAAGYGAYRYHWPADPKMHPPVVELTGADPLVAKAIESARAAVEAQPKSGATWGKLGMVLFAHDYYAESLACLVRAEELNPSDARWPYYQGLILMREHPEDAVAPLQRAATRAWRDVTPHLRLAEVLLDLDRLDESESEFRAVTAGAGDQPRALLGLGLIARRRGDLAGCLPLLERASTSPTARRAARVALAEAHQQAGHTVDAARLQSEVSRIGPDAAWPDLLLAEVLDLQTGTRPRLTRVNGLLNANRVADALSLIQQILLDDPTSDLAQLALGRALMQANNFAAAEKAMDDAIKLHPDSIDAHLLRGSALMSQGRSAAAAEAFRAALQRNPSHALAHLYLARCLRKAGDKPGAQTAFRDALRCRPDLAPAHVELAELLLENGKKDEALTHLRNALRLHPDDETVKKMIAGAEEKK